MNSNNVSQVTTLAGGNATDYIVTSHVVNFKEETTPYISLVISAQKAASPVAAVHLDAYPSKGDVMHYLTFVPRRRVGELSKFPQAKTISALQRRQPGAGCRYDRLHAKKGVRAIHYYHIAYNDNIETAQQARELDRLCCQCYKNSKLISRMNRIAIFPGPSTRLPKVSFISINACRTCPIKT